MGRKPTNLVQVSYMIDYKINLVVSQAGSWETQLLLVVTSNILWQTSANIITRQHWSRRPELVDPTILMGRARTLPLIFRIILDSVLDHGTVPTLHLKSESETLYAQLIFALHRLSIITTDLSVGDVSAMLSTTIILLSLCILGTLNSTSNLSVRNINAK